MAYSIDRMPERISIGRETETGVTDVMIDCGAWVMKWPGMTLHAIHTPEGGAPYILQTETDGGVLVWHVTDADTATPGTGLVEIVGETDGRRKVSAMVKVSVAARMSGTVGDPPEAAKPWVESVIGAADRITGMKAQAETLDAGSGATAAWDGEQGLLTIGVPKGDQGPKGEKGEKGPQGEKGEPGKDAVVDATLTQSGQAADAKATGDELALKLTEPSTGLAVGKYFRISAIDEAGHAVLEAVDEPVGGVQDVLVNGASIVADGVANVPIATGRDIIGLVKVGSSVNGIAVTQNGLLSLESAINTHINNRQYTRPITPSNLDYAVKAAMCDGKGAAWTSEEQAAARERMGFPGEWELIEETKITEEITQFKRTTEPNGNTYNFAAVVMRADFGEIPSDIEYNSAVYNVIYNEYDLYDYFTERKISRDLSLWSYVDCSGKCPNFNSFTAKNSGYSLVSYRTGYINSLGNNLKCMAVVINMVCAIGLFPAGVKFTIWGVRA